jgi:V/A-type H+-transporting ATPase subunit A
MTKGKVVGVNGNMVTVEVAGDVSMNEVAYVASAGKKLKAEVIRIRGRRAEMQIFEMSRGIGIGDEVEFTADLLSVRLGPGLLAQVYDGLQNPLPKLAARCGFFLERGVYLSPLDEEKEWAFTPVAKPGDQVTAADTLGTVPEGIFSHRIMVPFHLRRSMKVVWIAPAGNYRILEPVAELEDENGDRVPVTMSFTWPVKRPVTCYRERLRPDEPMVTKIRIIDTFIRPRGHLLHPRAVRGRKNRPAAGDQPQRRDRHRHHRRLR